MSKLSSFIDYVDTLIVPSDMPEEAKEYYQSLLDKVSKEVEKAPVTELGMQILEYLQRVDDGILLSAKEITADTEITTRRVAGALKKLILDGYAYKEGSDPIKYALTEQGKSFDIFKYKGVK